MKRGNWLIAAAVLFTSMAQAHVDQIYDPDDLERLLKTDLVFQETYNEQLTPEHLLEGTQWVLDSLGVDERILREKRLLIAGAIYTEYLRYGKTKRIAAELILQARAYFPLFEKIFSKIQGSTSSAIQFLAWIESRFNPKIVSPAKAVGMWQFIAATARSEGLTVSKNVDQRTNIYASTLAAAQHTQSLYAENELGSWDGVMIAYNAGPGRLRQILRDNECEGNRDTYLCGYDDLRPETQMYIPRLLAAAYIFTMYDRHGIGQAIEGYRKVNFFPECLSLREYPSNVSLTQLAKNEKIPYDQLSYFNLALDRTPNANGKITLTIPHTMETVEVGQFSGRSCDPETLRKSFMAQRALETPSLLPVLLPTEVRSQTVSTLRPTRVQPRGRR